MAAYIRLLIYIQLNSLLLDAGNSRYIFNYMVELYKKEESLDRVFAALADHSRRKMLTLLREGPRSISALAEPFSMSFAGVAKHVEVLASAGLVRKIRAPQDGRSFQIELQNTTLAKAADWLDYHQDFWTGKLDKLEVWMEEQERAQTSSENRKKH